MKQYLNKVGKGLAGLIFVALLVVNVQVGSGNSIEGIHNSYANEAYLDLDCPWNPFEVCGWFEWPDGDIDYEVGEHIVVTP